MQSNSIYNKLKLSFSPVFHYSSLVGQLRIEELSEVHIEAYQRAEYGPCLSST